MGEGVEGYDLPKFASLRRSAMELIAQGQYEKAMRILERIMNENYRRRSKVTKHGAKWKRATSLWFFTSLAG